MKLRTLAASIALLAVMSGVAYAAGNFRQVKPGEFDPGKTFLVQAQWLTGIGCPTNAKQFDGTTTTTYSDPACLTGDSGDKRNEGLLLAKTGPTTNDASAGASGSHCGAGAPRFNIELKDGTLVFVGCNSSATPVTTTTVGNGWLRLRWGGGSNPIIAAPQLGGTPINIQGKEVKSIEIVFDEGQDTGPDNFGLAVLDNIDVNGMLVGSHEDRSDHDKDKDKHKNHHRGEDSDDGD